VRGRVFSERGKCNITSNDPRRSSKVDKQSENINRLSVVGGQIWSTREEESPRVSGVAVHKKKCAIPLLV
jgi:hypothetical protein